jgi:hypothetical protein
MIFDAGTLMVALEPGNPLPDILPAMGPSAFKRDMRLTLLLGIIPVISKHEK